MEDKVVCPICGYELDEVDDYDKSKLLSPDELVWWCSQCCDFIFEEDFFYNTEE